MSILHSHPAQIINTMSTQIPLMFSKCETGPSRHVLAAMNEQQLCMVQIACNHSHSSTNTLHPPPPPPSPFLRPKPSSFLLSTPYRCWTRKCKHHICTLSLMMHALVLHGYHWWQVLSSSWYHIYNAALGLLLCHLERQVFCFTCLAYSDWVMSACPQSSIIPSLHLTLSLWL